MNRSSTPRRLAIAASSVLILGLAVVACDDDNEQKDDKDITDVVDSVVTGDTEP